MIDVQEIRNEIDRLENGDTTYRNLEKLSVLYAVNNSLQRQQGYSYQTEPRRYEEPVEAQSEFLQLCYSSDIKNVLKALDDHMKAVQLLYPKEYNKVINSIRNTK